MNILQQRKMIVSPFFLFMETWSIFKKVEGIL